MPEATKINAQVGIKVTLFDTITLFGGYQHKDDKDILVIKEMPSEKDTSVTVPEIAGHIDRMIRQFNPEYTGLSALEVKWPEGVQEILNSIHIYVNEVFLGVVKSKDGSATVEYALWTGIKCSEELKKKFPFVLDDLYLKIWKTDNKDVLESMNISQVEKLLENISKEGSKKEEIPG